MRDATGGKSTGKSTGMLADVGSIDLDAIQKRCDAASPGPWDACWRDGSVSLSRNGGYIDVIEHDSGMGVDLDQASRTAEFIANARQDIPAMVALLRDLHALGRHAYDTGDDGFPNPVIVLELLAVLADLVRVGGDQ